MPQTPIELLKRLAMQNVPQPTEEQRENRDFRAQALQDQEPTWKKAIGGALEGLTSFVTGDDMSGQSESERKGLTHSSPGRGVGALLAAGLPLAPRKLPIIAPEAYNDVK